MFIYLLYTIRERKKTQMVLIGGQTSIRLKHTYNDMTFVQPETGHVATISKKKRKRTIRSCVAHYLIKNNIVA